MPEKGNKYLKDISAVLTQKYIKMKYIIEQHV